MIKNYSYLVFIEGMKVNHLLISIFKQI